jgi:hypothetical protein
VVADIGCLRNQTSRDQKGLEEQVRERIIHETIRTIHQKGRVASRQHFADSLLKEVNGKSFKNSRVMKL